MNADAVRRWQVAAVHGDRIVGAVPKGGPALLIGELSAKLTERVLLNLKPSANH